MLVVVFTTILLDFVGFSVLLPVLPYFAERLGATPFQVGLILTVYALAQLLFLPVWGWASDRFGRRPVILTSLAGTAGAFVLLAAAQDLATVYAARILGGAFAANIGTAQAVVTDVTGPRERARGLGLVGAAFGIGFVVGPFVGGELAAIGERLPFFAVAATAAANLALAWRRLPESRSPDAPRPGGRALLGALVPAPLRLVARVHEPRLGLYLYLFFHIFASFAALEAMFPLYVGQRFGLGEAQAGRMLAWIGVFIALAQGVLVGRLAPRWGEWRLVVGGLAATGAGLVAVALVPHAAWLYAVGPVIAVGHGLAMPAFTSLYTQACRETRAGELLGQSQAMVTSGRIAGSAWAGGAFGALSPGAPFVLAGGLMGVAVLALLGGRRTLAGP